MPGGLDNPLGARTLYLYQNGAYTLYTIYASQRRPNRSAHGITSGCVGLLTSGHDAPVLTNAGQDEGGRPAGIAAALARSFALPVRAAQTTGQVTSSGRPVARISS